MKQHTYAYDDYFFDMYYFRPTPPVTAFIAEIFQDNGISYKMLYGDAMFLCGKNYAICVNDACGISFHRFFSGGNSWSVRALTIASQEDLEKHYVTGRKDMEARMLSAIEYYDNNRDIKGEINLSHA